MFTAHGGWDDAGTRIDGLPPHYTVIRLKPHFVQLLTDPKSVDQFTVNSALLSTPNICIILSSIML